jgi:hypothetical protein
MVGQQLVQLDASNAVNIKVLAQVFHNQGFHVQVTGHVAFVDALHGCRNFSENSEFLASIVKPGTL